MLRFCFAVFSWSLAFSYWDVSLCCSAEYEEPSKKATAELADGEVIDFNFHVKPILSDRCYYCHGPDPSHREGGFRLDLRESATGTDTDSGERPIVSGDPDASEMIRRMLADADSGEQMPPDYSKLSVTKEEIEILRRWIAQGAEWKPHWSFLPLESKSNTKSSKWARNEIDGYVQAKLKAEGLSPAPEADRVTLIRRLSYDLTGLPPTLAEIDAFVADKSEDAYEKLVDRLLASPRYGERMAVDWLDLARYADTFGYQADQYRETWPWRDWVIDSFNKNLPYDQFITWQLAGDLLPNATDEQILATAFNRLHRQTNEGGSIEEEYRTEYVVDRVDTFGASMLGLTVGCARCHDHKYDPISQKDYYQLFAFFNNIDESGLYSHFTVSTPTPTLLRASEQQKQNLARLQSELKMAEARLAQLRRSQAGFKSWFAFGPKKVAWRGLIGDFPMDEIQAGRMVNRVMPAEVAALAEEGVKTGEGDEQANQQQYLGKLRDVESLVAGKSGQAIPLTGENSFETTVGGQFSRHDPFTISLWIKTPKAHKRAVIWHRSRAWTDAGSRGYELVMEEGKLNTALVHFWPGNAASIRTKEKLPVNQWVQVTVTYDGSSRADGIRIYWDGKLQACDVQRDKLTKSILYTKSDKKTKLKEAHRLMIGQRFRDRGFKGGTVDELKIFNRELSAVEVTALATGQDVVQQLLAKGTQRSEAETQQLLDYYHHNFNDAYAKALVEVRDIRKQLNAMTDSIAEIMVMRELPERRPTFLLGRGAYDNPTEPVSAETPSSLPPMAKDLPRNRLGLAKWLTDPSHPLTARVAANRFWQSMLGQGLVATPDDLGSQGALPTHPELLDWLAESFIESGWDVKQLLKTIVMSATYRQSSNCSPELRASDPQNLLLARGPRHRLSAEMIRDGALFTSGLLSDQRGGPPVKPYQPAGLWKEKGTQVFTRDKGEKSHRASVYTYWKRTSPPPAMITLDAAKRDICIVKRQTTATPLQALVLLNDPQYVEIARALAEKTLLAESGPRGEQIAFAFRTVTSRAPVNAELDILEQLFDEQYDFFTEQPESAKEFLDIGDHRFNKELDTNELAAMTVVSKAIINLYETVTKQ